MDKEGDEVAEEKVELEQHVVVHRQLWDLAVLQGDHGLRGQRRAGHARPRTVPVATGEVITAIIASFHCDLKNCSSL